MKKIIMLSLAVLFIATPAFASNVTSPVDGKCINGDHTVYHRTTGLPDSCIPKADWEASQNQSTVGGLISVASGKSVMTTYGIVSLCPAWFPFGCTITPELFVNFL